MASSFISLRSKIGRGPPTQPGEEILSTVQIGDAAADPRRSRQSNKEFLFGYRVRFAGISEISGRIRQAL
jgi:hypothetical protein